jgi:hypothetical protein
LTGFVTVIGGEGGVTRVVDDESAPIPARFSFDQSAIGPGESVQTAADATAVLVLPGFDTTVYLGGSTKWLASDLRGTDTGVSMKLECDGGSASIIRKLQSPDWMLLVARAGAARGYTLSRGASLFVEMSEQGVSFSARSGDAWFFAGDVPEGRLVDESGNLIDDSGVHLAQGQRVTSTAPAAATADEEAGTIAPPGMRDDLETFALAQSDQWLQQAERGDFTPVRGPGRAAPEVMQGGLEPSLAFDQPRPVLTGPAPRPTAGAVRTTLDPAQSLVASGVPGTVVAGQRFRRSRIIGNPGTAGPGSGALTINRAADLLVRLGGN